MDRDHYMITCQVYRKINGWDSSRQIPTFHLPRDCGGMGSASTVANRIVNPYNVEMSVVVTVYDPVTGDHITDTY